MRLDKFLVENGWFASREKAQQALKDKRVFVDGKCVEKSSFEINDENVEIKSQEDFVSRGAYKLLGAVQNFGLKFEGKTVLDIGASTGGFTQVCLNLGAKKVYALDVGHGQLNPQIALDERVVNMEGLDFRQAQKLEDVNSIVSDISFISLTHILPILSRDYPQVEMVLLFKPQFECGERLAKKFNGVVLDAKLHTRLLNDFLDCLKVYNLRLSGLCYSPVCGKEGNIEYLVYINGASNQSVSVDSVVSEAFKKLKVAKTKKK